jgi:hypothetical protein
MKCRCGGDTFVTDSRAGELNSIRRRRECETCAKRFTTWETAYAPHQKRWAAKNGAAAIKKWREANPEKAAAIRLREKMRAAGVEP